MSIKDGHHKKVSFNTRDELSDKIDKLANKESRLNRQFRTHIHQSRGGGQNRNYIQRNYENRYRQINRSIVETENSTGKIGIGLDIK